MSRTAPLLMAALLIIGGVSAFPVAAAAQSSSSVADAIGESTYAQVDENASENATNLTAGERLSAVIGVGQAEFEGEIELRTYGIEFSSAATDNAKASVVADRIGAVQERLNELEQRKQALIEARENGTISDGEFQARMAELAARTETVEQMANASQVRAKSLPADVLEANGVNVSAIQMLKMNAAELSGGDVAAIAQSIAGPDVGQPVSQGPPSQMGVPGPDRAGDGDGVDAQATLDRAESQVDSAEIRLEEVEDRVNETNASDNATEALQDARDELERARQALEDARAAMDAGNEDDAIALAEEAIGHAEQAVEHAEEALAAAQESGQTDGSNPDGESGSSDSGDGDGDEYGGG